MLPEDGNEACMSKLLNPLATPIKVGVEGDFRICTDQPHLYPLLASYPHVSFSVPHQWQHLRKKKSRLSEYVRNRPGKATPSSYFGPDSRPTEASAATSGWMGSSEVETTLAEAASPSRNNHLLLAERRGALITLDLGKKILL